MARVDVSQVDNFARKLDRAARLVDEEAERFEEEWGGKWLNEMKATVPVDTGRLRDSIEQGKPGEISMEHYARFVEYGTARQAPQSFIRPSMKKVRSPATKDAGERAVNLIHKGR